MQHDLPPGRATDNAVSDASQTILLAPAWAKVNLLIDANNNDNPVLIFRNRVIFVMQKYFFIKVNSRTPSIIQTSAGKGTALVCRMLGVLTSGQDPENTAISARIGRTLIEQDNAQMGLTILQLLPGRDIATDRNFLNPIQNRIYEFAKQMRNIIHVVADNDTKQCIVVDAASASY